VAEAQNETQQKIFILFYMKHSLGLGSFTWGIFALHGWENYRHDYCGHGHNRSRVDVVPET
jgi:hypothetical protein